MTKVGGMDESVASKILEATGSKRIVSQDKVQSLWSGYGAIIRCRLAGGKWSSVVVKHVQPPEKNQHPRGWNTNLSHQRKLKSYAVELNWYRKMRDSSHACCRMAKLIDSWQKEGEILMILEDLDTLGYPLRKSSVSFEEIKVVLQWLACFHAAHLNMKPDGLWSVGSYWHLDTRPDEWAAMKHQMLKHHAKSIDDRLNCAQYQTIIHGDAKLANFCFKADGKAVAAVDFQYVGGGCGIKDVVYFLSSCLSDAECQQWEDELLTYYFTNLKESLIERSDLVIDSDAVIHEYRALYSYAWADFYRFLDGWSPGHWKMHDYSEQQVNNVLASLN